MNLWLRLLWLLLATLWRPHLDARREASSLSLRVWPGDLDLNLHMNNGRYLTIMDLGRLDLVLRTGLWRVIRSQGWAPMMGAAVIRYRQELRPFQRYRLVTRIAAWSDSVGVMEQTFIIDSGRRKGMVAARALVKAGFYDRSTRSFVPVRRLIEALGVAGEVESPPISPEVRAFLDADRALKRSQPHTARAEGEPGSQHPLA